MLYEVITETTDGSGAETKYEYNANGSVTKITYTDGTSTKFTYDNMGRIKTRITSYNVCYTKLLRTAAVSDNTAGYDEEYGTYEKAYSLDAFGEGIDLEYTPITGGMKENIILQHPTDVFEFSYLLNVENLFAYLV